MELNTIIDVMKKRFNNYYNTQISRGARKDTNKILTRSHYVDVGAQKFISLNHVPLGREGPLMRGFAKISRKVCFVLTVFISASFSMAIFSCRDEEVLPALCAPDRSSPEAEGGGAFSF